MKGWVKPWLKGRERNTCACMRRALAAIQLRRLTDCSISPVRIRIGVTQYTWPIARESGLPGIWNERIPFSDSHDPLPRHLGVFILRWPCPFPSENPDCHGPFGGESKFMRNRPFGKLYRALWHSLNWARPSQTRCIWVIFCFWRIQ